MHEQSESSTSTQELSQQERNQELLRNSELGVFLERAYIDAINLDPRLANIEILQKNESDVGIAHAVPSWSSETGKHQISVELDNLDETLNKHQETLDRIPGARELFSSVMGIKPDEITPIALHVFSILHEMGHITEFMDNENDPDALRLRQRREKVALPIGNATVSALMTLGTPARELVEGRWPEVKNKYGIETMDELLKLQHDSHRNMTSEKIADGFASDVFAVNPELVDVLLNPDVTDDYRDRASEKTYNEKANNDDPVEAAVDYAIGIGKSSINLENDLEMFKNKASDLIHSIRSNAESEGRDLSGTETNKIKSVVEIVDRQNVVIKRLKEKEQKVA
jgi:hypothetical protein